jgi:small subunit ribosomal protein S6
MRRYELMLLLRPDLEDDKLQAAVEKVTRAVVNGGGSLSKVSPWGKRRLAYDIGQHREASYFLIHFDIEPSQIREIERGMLITEEILRHLVTVLEDRGASDEELAPAAAPRDEPVPALDSDGDTSAEPESAPDAATVAEDDTAVVPEEAEDVAVSPPAAEAPAAEDPAAEAPAADEEAELAAVDEPIEVATDEEPAAAERTAG